MLAINNLRQLSSSLEPPDPPTQQAALDVRFLSTFGQRETTLSADKQRNRSPEESKPDCGDVERIRAVGAPLRRRQINGVIFD
jgi:hypothetical protein